MAKRKKGRARPNKYLKKAMVWKKPGKLAWTIMGGLVLLTLFSSRGKIFNRSPDQPPPHQASVSQVIQKEV